MHVYKRLIFSEIGTVCVCHCGHIDAYYADGSTMTFADLKEAVLSITSSADQYPATQSESSTPIK